MKTAALPRKRNDNARRAQIDSLESRCLLSATLAADINTQPAGSVPSYFTRVGDQLFFAADDEAAGAELWLTDGTGAGTRRVKDLNPGSADSIPQNLTNVDGNLYFTTQGNPSSSGLRPDLLWKSDGTEAGTVELMEFPGGELPALTRLVAAGNKLFFVRNSVLWTSDGTTEGTVAVKGFIYDYLPEGTLTSVNGTAFFAATDPTSGTELWKSDGTEAGTVMVKDITPGPHGSALAYFATDGKQLFFNANSRLWTSDGTPTGTFRVAGGGFGPSTITPASDTVYLFSVNAAGTPLLMKLDDVSQGTITIPTPGATPYSGVEATVGDRFFFLATARSDGDSEDHFEIWVTDGSADGTRRVLALPPQAPLPEAFTPVGDQLYFVADDKSGKGSELWRSDGTPEGTLRIKDINPGAADGVQLYAPVAGALGETLIFQGNDGITNFELWRSDGTEAGTTLVKDIRHGTNRSFFNDEFAALNGDVFVVAETQYAMQLRKIDPTGAVTTFDNVNPALTDLAPSSLCAVNGKLFFIAGDPSTSGGSASPELWISDGMENGTMPLRVFAPGSTPGAGPTVVDGTLFYWSNDSLWKTDGTVEGTQPVAKVGVTVDAAGHPNAVAWHGKLFFAGSTSKAGSAGLWESDGTEAGTFRVKNILPGQIGTSSASLTVVGDYLYFLANDFGVNLWRTDGTESGTTRVKVIPNQDSGVKIAQLTNVAGRLFLVVRPRETDRDELWTSDGAEAGTIKLREFPFTTKFNGDNLMNLTALGDQLLFSADDGVTGRELWTSDGTTAGTTPLKDILPGPAGSNPNSLKELEGRVYFSADDGVSGPELWVTDGTAAGTILAQDIRPGIGGSSPMFLGDANGVAYFTADDGFHGTEPWKLDPELTVAQAWVAGSNWSSVFESTLAAEGAGAVDKGFGIPLGAASQPLPWVNLNRLSVQFSEDVTIASESLRLSGAATAGVSIDSFTYDSASHIATWTFSAPLRAGAAAIHLTDVRDQANQLLPDDQPLVAFSTLPADVDRTAVVNASDLVNVRNRVGAGAAAPAGATNSYSVFSDVNGDGVVNATDLVLVRNRIGTSLPSAIVPPRFSLRPFRAERTESDLVAPLEE